VAASRQRVLLPAAGAGRHSGRALPAARAADADVEELGDGAALGDQVAVGGIGTFAVDLGLVDGKNHGFFSHKNQEKGSTRRKNNRNNPRKTLGKTMEYFTWSFKDDFSSNLLISWADSC
jgi:hypothetical protein